MVEQHDMWSSKDLQKIRVLMKAEDLNFTPDVFKWAVETDKKSIVDYILKHKPNWADKYSPIDWAVSAHETEMIKHLIDTNGLDVNRENERNMTPLYRCIHNNTLIDITTVKMLLSKGANPNKKPTPESSGLLWYAIRFNNLAVVDALLAGGPGGKADLRELSPDKGETMISFALAMYLGHNLSQVSSFNICCSLITASIKFPGVLDILNGNGETPLHSIAKKISVYPDYTLFRLLLAARANPNVTDSNGNTALYIMVQRLLLDYHDYYVPTEVTLLENSIERLVKYNADPYIGTRSVIDVIDEYIQANNPETPAIALKNTILWYHSLQTQQGGRRRHHHRRRSSSSLYRKH